MMEPTQKLPPLTWLRAFEATARHLSFTRAAGELNLTQSAVSQHVRALEAFLGRDLFIRKTRALELTEDGANYLPTVKAAFDLIASGTEAFIGGDRGRSLTLQCNLAFSVFWLAPRLHRLYRQHPWLVLNMVTPIWDPERHAGNAAVEIRFGLPDEMSRNAEQILSDRYYPVCSPDYQDGAIDLDSASLLDCAGLTGTWSAWFNSQKKPFDRNNEISLASTFVIAIQTALHSGGITMAHDTLATDLINEGKLIRPFEHCPELTEAYFLMRPSDHDSTPATRSFLSWLEAELAAFSG